MEWNDIPVLNKLVYALSGYEYFFSSFKYYVNGHI